ncbi:SpoIIE family protein phosphatase [Hugenholtzia roseola]|uniref:SpoIIE family protein phosphatase n=1 Tax=Hugenholtzia roseola TaxID=1002 RepID=UPI000479D4F2|nr:SpoIIE family protein phosphatase [Hugenholtzia roseola]
MKYSRFSIFVGKRQDLGFFSKVLCLCIFLWFSILGSFSTLLAQEFGQNLKGIARPLITNFAYTEYGGTQQNWAVTQGKNGFIYVGNADGVLEYDGKDWRAYPTANGSTVRSLAVSQAGEIFVGAKGEVGKLKADSIGNWRYVSFLNQIPEAYRNFDDVWQTFATKEGVFFRTNPYLFHFSFAGTFLKVVAASEKGRFHKAFCLDDDILIEDSKKGLLRVTPQTVQVLADTSLFMRDFVFGIYPDPEAAEQWQVWGRMKVGRLSQNQFETKSYAAQKHFEQMRAYVSTRLSASQIAVGTTRDGLFVIDNQGNIQLHLTKETGLQSSTIYDLFLDSEKNLWLATDLGIDCVHLGYPFWQISDLDGMVGQGLNLSLDPKRNFIYAGTTQGIYALPYPNFYNPADGKKAKFEFIPETQGYAIEVREQEQKLYFAHSNNVFEVSEGKATAIVPEGFYGAIAPTPLTPQLLVGRRNEGMAILQPSSEEGAKWQVRDLAGFEERTRNLLYHKGYWWVNQENKGIFRLKIDQTTDSVTEVRLYQQENGELPTSIENNLYLIKDKIYVNNEFGFFEYDQKTEHFAASNFWNDLVGKEKVDLKEDKAGNIWLTGKSGNRGVLRKKGDNSYQKEGFLLEELRRYISYGKSFLADSQLVFAVDKGFLLFDLNQKIDYQDVPTVFLRSVEYMGETDSLLFGGVYFDADSLPLFTATAHQRLVLPIETNNLRFTFASPFLTRSFYTEYRYRLEGIDEKWSAWGEKNQKEYTNLQEGEYRLHLQARNIWGVESLPLVYEFQVMPPWYRSKIAYLLYAIAIFIAIGLIVRLNTYRLERDKRRLEATIIARTAEISQQKEELQVQADNLMEANVAINVQKEEIATQAESLQKAYEEVEKSYQDIRTLSELGKKITHILDVSQLIQTVYENINALMPTDGFGIGLYNESQKRIEFKDFLEKGEALPFHYDSLKETEKFSVRCVLENEAIIIHDVFKEYSALMAAQQAVVGGVPTSLVYLPLRTENRLIGVLTVQSLAQHTYSKIEVELLNGLASYIAIALENITAYQVIANKNQNITDSIRYAKTIQEAILPTSQELERHFEAYSLLYKPKDIVSGDLYWVEKTETHLFVALVDCTGHGVPGAFMSMLAKTILSEAVSARKISSPAAILEWIHQQIKHTLRQEQTYNADGMDIVLCAFSKDSNQTDTMQVEFAGAGRSLWYQNPTKTDISRLKGTARSIGGYKRRKAIAFENHRLSLPKDTLFYLFTDGLTDQANPQDSKIGTQGLLNFLEKIAQEPLPKQDEALAQFLAAHQQDAPQRDDISFLAFRVSASIF